MNILYIALKHVIWRFRICNYSREIFRFRNFMNILRNFAKSIFVHIFAKSIFVHIFAKSIFVHIFAKFISTESPDHVL